MKKVLYIMFITLLGVFINLDIVHAEVKYDFNVSYSNKQLTPLDKNSTIEIKVKSNETTDGIFACFFIITTDDGISMVNSTVVEDNWNLSKENNNYLFNIEGSKGLLSSSGEIHLYDFTITANNSGKIYIKNIKCANSKDETSKNDIAVEIEYVEDNSNNSSKPSSSSQLSGSNQSSTSEIITNPKTGGKNMIVLVIISLLSLFIVYGVYKYGKELDN